MSCPLHSPAFGLAVFAASIISVFSLRKSLTRGNFNHCDSPTANLEEYLDSTYLKTSSQAGLSIEENTVVAQKCIQESIDHKFKLIMIRPDMVACARKMIDDASSKVLVGTVIDFPEGKSSKEVKLKEAMEDIENGADELDFVANYNAFKEGKKDLVRDEVLHCTKLGLEHKKAVKWIIESAALADEQIIGLCCLIRDVVTTNYPKKISSVFIKSSTGFYKTEGGLPNGATVRSITMMQKHSAPLPVKASGGVRTYEEADQMIKLGVKRIGTSSAKAIAKKQKNAQTGDY